MWAVKGERECVKLTSVFFSGATCGMPSLRDEQRPRPASTRVFASGHLPDNSPVEGPSLGVWRIVVDADIQRASPPAGRFTAFRPFLGFRVSDERRATAARVHGVHGVHGVSAARLSTARPAVHDYLAVFPLLFFSLFPLFFTRGFIRGGVASEGGEEAASVCARRARGARGFPTEAARPP